jgi:hypothetical protein
MNSAIMKKALLVLILGIFTSTLFAETKTEIRPSDLQKPITDYIAKSFSGYKIDKAFKIDTKGVITFNVCITKDKTHVLVTFNKEGKYLMKEPCSNECCEVSVKK